MAGRQMSDMRFLRYEHRQMVVAVFETDQREEPPGRPPTKEVVHVLAQSAQHLTGFEVQRFISMVYGGGKT